MGRWLARGALGVLMGLCAGQAGAQIVTNPDWLTPPDREVIAETYPKIAIALSLEGRAIVSCAIDLQGLPQNCAVVSVSPLGMGFENAALEVANTSRFRPRTLDGRAIEGGRVRIPIRFNMPSPQVAQARPAPAVPPAMANLAKQLAMNLEAELIARTTAHAMDVAGNTEDIGVDSDARAAARTAITEAGEKLAPDAARALAAHMAEGATESQILGLIAYHGSPGARAVALRQKELRVALAGMNANLNFQLDTKARTRLCTVDRCRAIPVDRPSDVNLPAPEWALRPTSAEVVAATPQLARAYGVSGWARLNCIVAEGGKPSFCIVARESPAGFQLGRAADSLSSRFVLAQTAMEAGAQGQTVSLLVEFPAAPARAPPATTAQAPPTAARLALARRLMTARDTAANLSKGTEERALNFRRAATSEAETSPPAILIDTQKGMIPSAVEAMAITYASVFTEHELEVQIAFEDGVAGAWLRARGPRLRQSLDIITKIFEAKVTDEARAIFCRSRACQ